MMPKDKKQSEKMKRLISTVRDQPPQREQRGPINQTFPTPFECKITKIQHNLRTAGIFSFVSEPFYLFSIGYRYLLRIKVETGFLQFLEVYIKVVPGEFDESLSWPCKEKVRVRVVDQNPLPSKRESIPYVIDFEKEPCSRPLHDDYHEYRCILEKHVVLNSCVKNDTILIRVN